MIYLQKIIVLTVQQNFTRGLHLRLQSAAARGIKPNLEEKLDEDSGRAVGVVFVQLDDRQDRPADGVGEQQVGENLGHVPEFLDVKPEKELDAFIGGSQSSYRHFNAAPN